MAAAGASREAAAGAVAGRGDGVDGAFQHRGRQARAADGNGRRGAAMWAGRALPGPRRARAAGKWAPGAAYQVVTRGGDGVELDMSVGGFFVRRRRMEWI